MGIINVLPQDISNKIAAGEVVERPASVVKELVENAIDAGADVINIEIKKGGTTYIRVADNGSGMAREDAEVAFLRHATSKIHTENDLDAIYTLGFRGEALSSIGAVSVAELYTRRKEDEAGVKVVCAGGEITLCEDAGVPVGTTFVVNNLFYNTPARMNFLKRDATEAAAVTDYVERFILSHPEISFRYIIDGKDKYFTAGDGNLANCIYAVYGKSFAKSVIPVHYETEFLKITGMAGRSDTSRPNRTHQSFFVNKRYIRSKLIYSAVERAYKNQVMIGKYPLVVLNIEVNPRHIDINVHPTKLDIKFSRSDDVFSAVFHALENALYAIPDVPKIESKKPQKSEFSRDAATTSAQIEISAPAIAKEEIKVQKMQPAKKSGLTSYALDVTNEYFAKKQNDLIGETKPFDAAKAHMAAEGTGGAAIERFFDVKKTEPEPAELEIMSPKPAEPEIKAETVFAPEPEIIKMPTAEPSGENPWGFDTDSVRIIGQVFGTYILAQSGDTMIIADQHAAHERLKYEELKKELAEREVISQALLFPVTVELSGTEYAAYEENSKWFSDAGFEIEEFGGNALLVRATPEALDGEELKSLIIELLSGFAENGQETVSQRTERALYTIACKAAVKANREFDKKQLEVLLEAVLALDNINTCPHGRPIIITMSKKEMEKEFKRIV